MTTALDYRQRGSLKKTNLTFGKAMKVYGGGKAKVSKDGKRPNQVTTDFQELTRLQIEQSEKQQKATYRFIAFIGLAIVFFLAFYLSYTVRLPILF